METDYRVIHGNIPGQELGHGAHTGRRGEMRGYRVALGCGFRGPTAASADGSTFQTLPAFSSVASPFSGPCQWLYSSLVN